MFLILTVANLSACTKLSQTGETNQGTDNLTAGTVTIAYAEPITDYSPLNYLAINRKYLSNIYEPLVKFNRNFSTETALAVSWGRIDDLTWEFHLRKDVLFHDGTTFDSADAVYSLNLAASDKNSDLHGMLSGIESATAVGTDRIRIKTLIPDALLLNRLTYIYMIPDGYTDFNLPIGTGPYGAKDFKDNTLTLERFNPYWGPLPYFDTAKLIYIPSPEERISALISNQVQFLASVPPEEIETLKTAGMTVEVFPALEVSYLMLNQGGVLKDTSLRTAVWNAIGSDYAGEFGGGYLESTFQYAASGILGSSKSVKNNTGNLEAAQEHRSKYPGNVTLTLDVPEGLTELGNAIKDDLARINVVVQVNTISSEELAGKIENGTAADIYFFGWKYDLADLAEFFENVTHTKTEKFGLYNGFNYSNAEMDGKIENLSNVLLQTDRSVTLMGLSARFKEEKTVYPLFEAQNIYALSPDISWVLRLDGQIWAVDLMKNVLE